MARKTASSQPFNIMIIGQGGRLQYEALLFSASLRENSPGFRGRVIVVEPQPGPLWPKDPTMNAEIKEVFKITGAGKIAGCIVTDGYARRHAGVRLLRDNVVIHEGRLSPISRSTS